MPRINCMTHNLAGHLTSAKARRAAGRSALERCVGGIGGLNEINALDLIFLRRTRRRLGLKWWRRGQNAVVWDPRTVTMEKVSIRKIMQGGYVGADGTKAGPDNRRVGPSRYALKWCGHHNRSGIKIMTIVVHKVASSYTTEKWRLPLLLKSHVNTVTFLKEDLARYPNGQIIGDENSVPLVEYLKLNDVAVRTPATLGNKRYDQVHIFGDVEADDVKEWHSPSDHDGVQWDLVLNP